MGLFDRKRCSVCDGKIGLLGNRKLADGDLCKSCAAQLSPWFTERKRSTVAEIRQQLALRQANQAQLSVFHPSRVIGEGMRVYIDQAQGRFIVTNAQDIHQGNPDIIDMAMVSGCDLDIDENRSELTYSNEDNEQVSYNPPRYEYRYTFWFRISLTGHPYLQQLRFRLNPRDVIFGHETSGFAGAGLTLDDEVRPETDPAYCRFQQMAEELKAALTTAG